MIITIDGPTASGKSTTAALLAQKLGFFYLNSGFLYRALAYLLMRDKGYTLEILYNPAERDIRNFLDPKRLTYTCDQTGHPVIKFDGSNITPYLKGNSEIDQAASIVSTHKTVRNALLDFQRNIGLAHNIVIDGRDSGTIVFPDANFKFYLTAPIEIRASRWAKEQEARGILATIETATKQLALRDERDMNRPIAPLVVPYGAIIIDNGPYTLDETVDMMYKIIVASK